ncbi:MAG: hypothetical protein LUQ47_00525, partial [Methanotrichaceae archaeon]|nr:hypothetical protein [Methanotrichaceae archaeon]
RQDLGKKLRAVSLQCQKFLCDLLGSYNHDFLAQQIAEGVLNVKAPLLFVVPKNRGYSFRADHIKISGIEEKPREAFFLGLGDAIIPTILVISANWSLAVPSFLFLGLTLPALGAMLGTYGGFLALMAISRDKPQAGLPFLNSGALLGFLIGCALVGIKPF